MEITIYKLTCTKAYQMSDQYSGRYSMRPWGKNTDYYEGHDDGGEQYILPEGFEYAETRMGDCAVYLNDKHCPLSTMNGKPYLITDTGRVFLKKVTQ